MIGNIKTIGRKGDSLEGCHRCITARASLRQQVAGLVQIIQKFCTAFCDFCVMMIDGGQQIGCIHRSANRLEGFCLWVRCGHQHDGASETDIRFFAPAKCLQNLPLKQLHFRIIRMTLEHGIIDFQRLLIPIIGGEDGSLANKRGPVLRLGLDGAVQMVHRLRVPGHAFKDIGAIDMRIGVIWLQRDGFFKKCQCCLDALDGKECQTTGMVKSRILRRHFDGAAMAVECFLWLVKRK